MIKVIVLGNGGHSKVIQDMILDLKGHKIIAILDDKFELIHEGKGIVYGPLSYVDQLINEHVYIAIAIGHNATRKLLARKLGIKAEQYLTIIHPTARVSSTANIGNGTVVMPGAFINAEAIVGEHCIINTGAIVEHENTIKDYAHISCNATLTGNVSVGEGAHIGASATIIPKIYIGSWSIIGAGSTVIKHIPSYSKAVGCPTRILNSNQKKEKSGDEVVMQYEKS